MPATLVIIVKVYDSGPSRSFVDNDMKVIPISVALLVFLILSCTTKVEWQEVKIKLPFEHPTEIASLYERSGERSLAARQSAEAGSYAVVSELLAEGRPDFKDSVDRRKVVTSHRWIDADSLILQKAAEHELVMFNEDHNQPHARLMLLDLLPDLRDLGYEYLALEALGNIPGRYAYDSLIYERGYPIVHSGIYTREATFSMLVREASKLGFTIIGYDQGSGVDREITGAQNIIEQITQESVIPKTIVLCGWDHIREGPTHSYWEYALAERLRQKTGLDPLTIASTTFVNSGDKAKNHPLVNLMPRQERLALLDRSVDTTYSEQDHPYYDLEVFQPRLDVLLPWSQYEQICLPHSAMPDSLTAKAMLYVYGKTDDVSNAVPIYRTSVTGDNTCYPRLMPDQQVLVTDGTLSVLRVDD
jgi:hypothetical protein